MIAINHTKHHIKKIITAFILGFVATYIFFYLPAFYTSAVLFFILTIIIGFELPKLFSVKTAAFWLIMPFYPVLPFILMIYMNSIPQYRLLLFIMIFMVFSNDIGAYIIGNLFGKIKLAPSISPQKTWEGFWGGALFTCLILSVFSWCLNLNIHVKVIIILSIIVSIIATIGDLLESSLKRRVGIKDSASFLPGHGGFLDRFDSVLITVFLFFLLRDYLVVLLRINSC